MDENALLHYPESKFCFALGQDTVCLRLRISKSDNPDRINVVYGGKYTYATVRKTAQMQRICEDRLFAYYSAVLKLNDLRLVYVF